MGVEQLPDAEGPGAGPDVPEDTGPAESEPDHRHPGTDEGHPGGDADVLLDRSPSHRPLARGSPEGLAPAGDAAPPEPAEATDQPHRALDWEGLAGEVIEIGEPETRDNHVNRVLFLTLDDGSRLVYKPVSGEAKSLRASIPNGGQGIREVAAHVLDTELSIGLVPPTYRRTGPEGPGSAQDFVAATAGCEDVDEYSLDDRERMAVLDYVSGNTDRHDENYMTDAHGRPVAIDNGYAFPESEACPIRSDFVADRRGQPLSDDLITRLRAVDTESLGTRLQQEGLSEPAARGVRDRLREVQDRGAITFEAWPGEVMSTGAVIKERD